MTFDESAEGAIRRALDALAAAGVPYMLTGSLAFSEHRETISTLHTLTAGSAHWGSKTIGRRLEQRPA
jgi:hypothetical protein